MKKRKRRVGGGGGGGVLCGRRIMTRHLQFFRVLKFEAVQTFSSVKFV